MLLTDEDCEKLRKAHKEDFGEDITLAEAREIGSRLIELSMLISKPLPEELKAHAKQLSEETDSSPPEA